MSEHCRRAGLVIFQVELVILLSNPYTGESQNRELLWTPVPQERLHSSHSPHCPQPPSTGSTRELNSTQEPS